MGAINRYEIAKCNLMALIKFMGVAVAAKQDDKVTSELDAILAIIDTMPKAEPNPFNPENN
jgi:hypothetical protein